MTGTPQAPASEPDSALPRPSTAAPPPPFDAGAAGSAAPSILVAPGGASLAYHRLRPARPGRTGVVFIHGFQSDMEGGKALFLEDWCRARGRAFVRFDQSGHGHSSGRFEDGTIGAWARDVIAILDSVTEGPQVLVGSSMGGWLMLLATLARPNRVAGLVGLAPAPDFTEDLMWDTMSPETRAELIASGRLLVPNAYDDTATVLTRALIEDGRTHLLLRGDPPPAAAITCPLRIIQGQQDTSVPWQTALRLAGAVGTADVATTLVQDGDHRLSRPQDLARLGRVLGGLLDEIEGAIPAEPASPDAAVSGV